MDNKPLTLTAEVHARGLYDSLRRFLGTIGLIRDLHNPNNSTVRFASTSRTTPA